MRSVFDNMCREREDLLKTLPDYISIRDKVARTSTLEEAEEIVLRSIMYSLDRALKRTK